MSPISAAKVVVGVSGSIAGLAALRFSVAEAARRAVPLYAIRAWPFLRQWHGVPAVGLQRELAAEARRCIDEAFDAAMGGRPTDVEVVAAAHCGRTDLVLTDVAGGGHDLLVIGGRIGRRLGWVVRGCMRGARCPVVVVPPPELARAAGGRLSVRQVLREVVAARREVWSASGYRVGGVRMHGIEIILPLVAVAVAVAASARLLRVPAPSLLVVAGVLVAVIPGVPAVEIAPDVVSLIVLAPLLYAAGQDLRWRELRPVWRPVTVLAVGLVLASAAAVGAVAVAVTALGRRLALPARLNALLQAESLFNDATSLVLVRVAVAAAVTGGTVPVGRGIGQFAWLAGGGAVIGAVLAAGVTVIRRRTEDPVLETVIALVTPYAGYVAAETLRVSGITAVVVASVILAGQATKITSPQIRLQVHAVYDTVVFLLESIVFSLIGLQLPALIRRVDG